MTASVKMTVYFQGQEKLTMILTDPLKGENSDVIIGHFQIEMITETFITLEMNHFKVVVLIRSVTNLRKEVSTTVTSHQGIKILVVREARTEKKVAAIILFHQNVLTLGIKNQEVLKVVILKVKVTAQLTKTKGLAIDLMDPTEVVGFTETMGFHIKTGDFIEIFRTDETLLMKIKASREIHPTTKRLEIRKVTFYRKVLASMTTTHHLMEMNLGRLEKVGTKEVISSRKVLDLMMITQLHPKIGAS